MQLVIHAHTLKNEPLSQPITGRFDERGGTIGRSDTNTLALPDPERHISRLHAEVEFINGGFSIRNVGSANPISVNKRPLSPGESAPIVDGDEIMVGSYGLRVALAATTTARSTDAAPAIDSRTVIKASASESKTSPAHSAAAYSGLPPLGSQDPFADLLNAPTLGGPVDPFADLMGARAEASSSSAAAPAPAASYAPAAPHPVPPMALGTPTVAPPPARLPDDFDPFADTAPPRPGSSANLDAFMRGSSPPPSQQPRTSAAGSDSPFGDLLGSASGGSSLDDMFGLSKTPNAANADPLAGFLSPTPASAGQGRQANQDPMAMFGDEAPSGVAIPADFNHTPELQAAYRPPAIQAEFGTVPAYKFVTPDSAPTTLQPTAPPLAREAIRDSSRDPVRATRHQDPTPSATPPAPRTAPPPPTAGAASTASPEALWAAFCEGAGINMQLPQGLNPELMRMIGQVMHHSVEGTLKLVQVRAAAKQELRAQVTTIQARNNNPLKFSPDAGAAIEQLLQPPMRGFMVGPAAVNDAMDDLLGHAIGTMAGMRAALDGVLQRFEPTQLESKLVGNSVLDTVLPMNRRAKLWELYLQHFKRIQGDATEDFHELFGKAFIRAYEDQLDRLDQARHPTI